MAMRIVLRVEPSQVVNSGTVQFEDGAGQPLPVEPLPIELLSSGAGPNRNVWGVRPEVVPSDAVYYDIGTGDADGLRALLKSAEERTIDRVGLLRLGRLLFDTVLGVDVWFPAIEFVSDDDSCVELAIRLAPELDTLQNLPWELLHDGTRYLGLQNQPCVSIVRLLPAPPRPPGQQSVKLPTLERMPRVLFAVGASLTDSDVRPGAEFMGVLRRLEQEGGTIRPRVLAAASRSTLADQVRSFKPDIVHLIAHGRLMRGVAELQVQPDPGEGEQPVWKPARDIAATLGNPATALAVVLSACSTGRVGAPGSPSMAAAIVARGVPIVAAMAGDVADKACRLFTRAVAAAIVNGQPVSTAVASGRQAAFDDSTGVATVDWALPVLYLADSVAPGYVLADPTEPNLIKARVQKLDFARVPMFCGRQEFVDDFDRLIDPNSQLAVLGAILTQEPHGVGSQRLLRELAARAIRDGHVPVLVGPYELTDDGRPTDRQKLTVAIAGQIASIRKKLVLEVRPSDARAAITDDPQIEIGDLLDELRKDLFALAADVKQLRFTAEEPVPVLLLGRIESWDRALADVLFSMDTTGFGAGNRKLPMVFTGAIAGDVGTELRTAWEQYVDHIGWKQFRPLFRWTEAEDELAYQWLLLNPVSLTNGPTPPVYTVRRGASAWLKSCRLHMSDKPMFDQSLYSWAQVTGEPAQWLDANDDTAAVERFPDLAQ